jgi:hypothetical protein
VGDVAKKKPSPWLILIFVALLAVGFGIVSYAVFAADADTPATSGSAGASPPVRTSASTRRGTLAAARLRVADLMRIGGCRGQAIGTQLYSYETGRCRLDGVEVTIAVFDSAKLRDQWVDTGRGFGFTFAVGDGFWAAAAERPDAATKLAEKLGGRVL